MALEPLDHKPPHPSLDTTHSGGPILTCRTHVHPRESPHCVCVCGCVCSNGIKAHTSDKKGRIGSNWRRWYGYFCRQRKRRYNIMLFAEHSWLLFHTNRSSQDSSSMKSSILFLLKQHFCPLNPPCVLWILL